MIHPPGLEPGYPSWLKPSLAVTCRPKTICTTPDGWTREVTVVQVVTDDMPYLVDSVAAEPPEGATAESWIYVEIDLIADPNRA